jgi:hypothetical protein
MGLWKSWEEINNIIDDLFNSPFGGTASSGGGGPNYFISGDAAFSYAFDHGFYNNEGIVLSEVTIIGNNTSVRTMGIMNAWFEVNSVLRWIDSNLSYDFQLDGVTTWEDGMWGPANNGDNPYAPATETGIGEGIINFLEDMDRFSLKPYNVNGGFAGTSPNAYNSEEDRVCRNARDTDFGQILDIAGRVQQNQLILSYWRHAAIWTDHIADAMDRTNFLMDEISEIDNNVDIEKKDTIIYHKVWSNELNKSIYIYDTLKVYEVEILLLKNKKK